MTKKTTWGGARKGAGRKPTGKCLDAPHRARPEVKKGQPLYVVLRTKNDVPPLRRGPTLRAIAGALEHVQDDPAFRVGHVSIEDDQVHLVIAAGDKDALSEGMRSLVIRVARAINRVLGRTGRVFAYRYNAKPLTNAQQLRGQSLIAPAQARRRVRISRGERSKPARS